MPRGARTSWTAWARTRCGPMRIRGVDEDDVDSEELMMVYPLADAAGVPTSL